MKNREIKFRVWNSKNKEMIYPSESFRYTLSLCGEVFRDLGTSIKDKEKCIIQQFTGLSDKYNQEIYEGDLLSFPRTSANKSDTEHYLGQVIYEDAKFSVLVVNNKKPYIKGKKEYFVLNKHTAQNMYEVVGNVFENNNLIEK